MLFGNVFCTVTLSYQENSSFTFSECSYLSFQSFLNFKLEGTSFCDESTQAQQFFNLHAIWWDEFKAWRALTIIYIETFALSCQAAILRLRPESNDRMLRYSNINIIGSGKILHGFYPFSSLFNFPQQSFSGLLFHCL